MLRVVGKRLTPDVGWFALGSLVALNLLAGFSTYRADWSDGLVVAVRAVLLGTLVAYVLARPINLPDWVAHPLALVLGGTGVLWLLQGLLSDQLGGWREKLAFLWVRWERWYLAIRQGERAEDFYLFLLLIAVTHLAIGYIATWLVVRHDHAWVSVLLPTTVVLINAGYSRNVSVLLVALAVLLSLLIVGRVSFAQRMQRWRRGGLTVGSGVAWESLWVLAWLSVAVLLFGWIIPFSTHSTRAAAALQPTNRPWTELRDTLAEWFPSVRGPGGGRGGVGGFASFGDRFDIGGPLRLSDEPVLLVVANNAAYLTVRTYDTYTGRGWRSSAVPDTANASDETLSTPTESVANSEPVPLVEFADDEELPKADSDTRERETVRYHVEVLQSRGAALAYTGDPVSFSIPVRALYGWTDSTEWRTIDLGSTAPEQMPLELRPLVELLRDVEFTPAEERSPREPTPTPDPYAGRPWFWWFMAGSPVLPQLDTQISHLAARGIEVTFWWETTGQGGFRITRLAYRGRLPDYADLEAVYPANGMSRGLAYDFVTAVSRATPEQLRAAGEEDAQSSDGADVVTTLYGVYPRDLYQRYTQLPETVTERTRQLAYALAAGKSNAYDVASTIEAFVRERISYNEAAPYPGGVDAVDTVLFVRPEGYCTFYASAMAVLLRAVGIPARVAVGYYPADFDSDLGGFLYRDRNAHAWVEVFFPGYGWIPFEPTASRPPIPRGAIPGQSDLLPIDPILGANLPTDERFGLRLPELDRPEGAGAVGSAASASPARPSWAKTTLIGFLVLLASASVIATAWWLWGTWRLPPAARLFVRLQRLASIAGLRPAQSLTPLEFAWEVGRLVPGTRRAAETIAQLYSREQYGRRPVREEELRLASRLWREVLRPRLVRAAFRLRLREEAEFTDARSLPGRRQREH